LTAILSAAKRAEALLPIPFKKEYAWIALIGIVLPLVALIVELALRICASHAFDPFPSNGHALLFALIPISNLLILMSVRRDFSEHYAFLTLLNGMASGIALTYALMFLPLLPISLLFVLLLGFGFLGLAPFLALLSTIKAGGIICNLARDHKIYFEPDHAKHLGHLLIIASVVAIELPSTLTRIHLDMAAHPEQAHEGIDWLRKYGNQEVMLRACYERSGRATDILGSLFEAARPLEVKDAREIFYKVTGKPFNSVPIPMAARATMQHAGVTIDGKSIEDEFDVDTDIAGEDVSSISRGLSLSSSKITGEAVLSMGLAKLNWRFGLQNISKYKREARAKVALPPGSVVTRASLWIDGRRHDAAISERSEARHVYRASLVQEDHPLLVSTCGPDQVLVQCYPIKPFTKVEIELAIVAPFQLLSLQEGTIVLPSLSEQNFASNLDSDSQCVPGRTVEGGKIWMCPVHVGFGQQSSEFNTGANTYVATQELIQANQWVPSKLTVIVDGSASMATAFPEVLGALKTLPSGVPTKLVFVSDNANQTGFGFSDPGSPAVQSSLQNMERVGCVGGQDDTPQLMSALREAVFDRETAILWIHGSQPVGSTHREIAQAWLKADRNHPLLYDLQAAPGPVEILNGIASAPGLEKVQRSGSVEGDLQKLFAQWAERSPRLQFRRVCTRLTRIEPPQNVGAYNEEVMDLAANQLILAENARTSYSVSYDASTLATNLHIVTPISSAILTLYIPQEESGAQALLSSAGQTFGGVAQTIGGVAQGIGAIAQGIGALVTHPAGFMESVSSQLNNLSSAGGTATYAPYGQSTEVAAPAGPALKASESGDLSSVWRNDQIGVKEAKKATTMYDKMYESKDVDEEDASQSKNAGSNGMLQLLPRNQMSFIRRAEKQENKLIQLSSIPSYDRFNAKLEQRAPMQSNSAVSVFIMILGFLASVFAMLFAWQVRSSLRRSKD